MTDTGPQSRGQAWPAGAFPPDRCVREHRRPIAHVAKRMGISRQCAPTGGWPASTPTARPPCMIGPRGRVTARRAPRLRSSSRWSTCARPSGVGRTGSVPSVGCRPAPCPGPCAATRCPIYATATADRGGDPRVQDHRGAGPCPLPGGLQHSSPHRTRRPPTGQPTVTNLMAGYNSRRGRPPPRCGRRDHAGTPRSSPGGTRATHVQRAAPRGRLSRSTMDGVDRRAVGSAEGQMQSSGLRVDGRAEPEVGAPSGPARPTTSVSPAPAGGCCEQRPRRPRLEPSVALVAL